MLFGDDLVITMRRFVLRQAVKSTREPSERPPWMESPRRKWATIAPPRVHSALILARLGYLSPTGDLLAYQGIELLRRAAPALMP